MKNVLELVSQGRLLEAFRRVYEDMESTGTTAKRGSVYSTPLPDYSPGPSDFVNRSYADSAYTTRTQESTTVELEEPGELFKYDLPLNKIAVVTVSGDSDVTLHGDGTWLSGREIAQDGSVYTVEIEPLVYEAVMFSKRGYVIRSEINKVGKRWAGTVQIFPLGDFWGESVINSLRSATLDVEHLDAKLYNPIVDARYSVDINPGSKLELWIPIYSNTDITITKY